MRTSGGKCDAGECGGVFGRHEREMDDVHWAGATFSAKYGTTWRPSSSSDSDVDELLGEASYIFSFAIAGGEKGGLVAGDDGEGGRETSVSVLAVRQSVRHRLLPNPAFALCIFFLPPITPSSINFSAKMPSSYAASRSDSGRSSYAGKPLSPPSSASGRIPVTPAVLRSIFASSRSAMEERSISRIAFFR